MTLKYLKVGGVAIPWGIAYSLLNEAQQKNSYIISALTGGTLITMAYFWRSFLETSKDSVLDKLMRYRQPDTSAPQAKVDLVPSVLEKKVMAIIDSASPGANVSMYNTINLNHYNFPVSYAHAQGVAKP